MTVAELIARAEADPDLMDAGSLAKLRQLPADARVIDMTSMEDTGRKFCLAKDFEIPGA